MDSIVVVSVVLYVFLLFTFTNVVGTFFKLS